MSPVVKLYSSSFDTKSGIILVDALFYCANVLKQKKARIEKK